MSYYRPRRATTPESYYGPRRPANPATSESYYGSRGATNPEKPESYYRPRRPATSESYYRPRPLPRVIHKSYILPYIVERQDDGTEEIYYLLPVVEETLAADRIPEETDYYTVSLLGGTLKTKENSDTLDQTPEAGALRELCEETINTVTASSDAPKKLIATQTIKSKKVTHINYFAVPVRSSRELNLNLVKLIADKKQRRQDALLSHSKEDSFLYIFTAQQLTDYPHFKDHDKKFASLWSREQRGSSSIDNFEAHLEGKSQRDHVIKKWDTVVDILPTLRDAVSVEDLIKHYHTARFDRPPMKCTIYKD